MNVDQSPTNPFASPSATGEAIDVVPGDYEVQGERLVGTDKIVLPHACVKCGEVLPSDDSSTRRKKDLYWVHPAIFVLVIQLLIFLIVYLVARKKCHVEYSICRECHARQRMNLVYLVGALAFFIGMIALLVNLENAWLVVGVLIGFGAMLTFAVRANGPLAIKTYKKGEFQLRGAGSAFLQFAQRCIADKQANGHPAAATVVVEDGRLA